MTQVSASGCSHLVANHGCRLSCASFFTSASKISAPTRSDCASVPCRRSRLFGLDSISTTTVCGSSRWPRHPTSSRQPAITAAPKKRALHAARPRLPRYVSSRALPGPSCVLPRLGCPIFAMALSSLSWASRDRATFLHQPAREKLKTSPSPAPPPAWPRSPSEHSPAVHARSAIPAAQTPPPPWPAPQPPAPPSTAPSPPAARVLPAACPSAQRSSPRRRPPQTPSSLAEPPVP